MFIAETSGSIIGILCAWLSTGRIKHVCGKDASNTQPTPKAEQFGFSLWTGEAE